MYGYIVIYDLIKCGILGDLLMKCLYRVRPYEVEKGAANLAQLFAKTASQLSQENPAQFLLDEINRYLAVFRERPLPRSRQEFETRATLLQLLRDLETFISIKVEFYQNYQKELQA